MAIQKRFIHFKKFSDFNSKKLSANEANTQYTVGVSGAIQDGEPDILYQSYVWIKDTKQQWTHAQLYGNDYTVDLTYEELKSLRDNAQLIPGQQYRITDYVTTTSQNKTSSVGHSFDVIVTADTNNTLNEEARACQSEFDIQKYLDAYNDILEEEVMTYMGPYEYKGKMYHLYESYYVNALVSFNETLRDYIPSAEYPYKICPSFITVHGGNWETTNKYYIYFKNNPKIKHFDNSNLSSWRIWYCLDNNTKRFDWADTENGKGVIYRMIDEFGNDCPYDFKNIIFLPEQKYTFASGGAFQDNSLHNSCRNNTIFNYYEGGIMRIPNIRFNFDDGCINNTIEYGCTNITLGSGQDSIIDNNLIGERCHDITLDCIDVVNNTFGKDCFDIYIRCQGALDNSIGGDCSDFIVSNISMFSRNIIGSNCEDISFSTYNSSENIIGHNCRSIHLAGYGHVIGSYCSNIHFKKVKSGYSNVVGDYCCNINTADGIMEDCYFGLGCNTINCAVTTTVHSVKFDTNVQNINVNYVGQYNIWMTIRSGNYNDLYLQDYPLFEYPCFYADVTYDKLVKLRDNAQLTKGGKYRIIDYNTTTSQNDTTSAGHRFDIIVTAIDEGTLSEEAQVAQNINDGYFDDSNLSAWKIWYSLDNDTERFAWAGDERIESTIVDVVDTSNCTISVGYSYDDEEGLNKFDNRVSFISQVWDDPVNDAYLEGSAIDELITHWGYETDPNGIENCLTLYGLNLEFDEETGEITSEDGMSEDRWYYRGIVTVDDTDYDYWEKAEWGGDNGELCYMDQNENCSEKLFFLTNRIVSGSPTVETITQEIVIPLEPKGVIYYMKDEHDNEAPYDFKNIQFKRYKVTSDLEGADLTTLSQEYVGYPLSGYGASMPFHISLADESDYKYVYTFSCVNNGSIVDASLGTSGIACYDNSMKLYIASNVQYLNDIVMYAHPESGNHCITKNTFASDCFSMTLGCEQVGEVWDNHFGQYCKNNIILGPYVYQNDFGANLTACYFSQQVSQNNIGSYMQRNFVNNTFVQNVLGPNCKDNIFMKKCSLNTIGEQFMNNTCNDEFYQNNLGAGFLENTFNGKFYSNASYNQFMRNTINGQCSCCDFGTQCTGNTLGIFRNSKVGSLFMSNVLCDTMACVFGIGFNCNNVTATKMQCSTFGTYVMYNNWTSSGNVKNIKVSDYLQGTTSSYNNIELPADSVCEVKVAKNSSGDIKIYCEADLIS